MTEAAMPATSLRERFRAGIEYRRIRFSQWWNGNRERVARALVRRLLRWGVRDNPLVEHAMREMGPQPIATFDGNPDRWMYDHTLDMVRLFCLEGHSGFSASFARGRLGWLLAFKPLRPLTGEPDEWNVGHMGADGSAQNIRRSSVFQDPSGVAYDIDGFVFREPADPDGYRPMFQGYESRRIVRFPYAIPDEPVIVDVPADSTHEQRIEAIRACGVPDEDIYVVVHPREPVDVDDGIPI